MSQLEGVHCSRGRRILNDNGTADAAAAFALMGRRWLGIGNLDSTHWFCGLEPGGTERPERPGIWATRFARAEVIDGRAEAGDADHARWFEAASKGQPTWIALVRTLLAFEGRPYPGSARVA